MPSLMNTVCVLLVLLCASVAGCANRPPINPIDPKLYASGSAYTYQPLNPTTVWIRDPSKEEQKGNPPPQHLDADETSKEFKKALLRDLDTETVRISLNTFNGDLKANATVVGVSVAGQSYVLVVDYIKYITYGQPLKFDYKTVDAKGKETDATFDGTVPIYTGIGLRIRAEFQANQSGLNISGLPAIAVAATANGISGRLTVQTLGITGQEVTSLMPLISDISVASIQNAVQAVAAIKAKIYEPETELGPKIVGFESPGQDPALIREITQKMYASELTICPVVGDVKDVAGQTQKILWIYWFTNPNDDERCDEESDEKSDDRPGNGNR